ncbi:radical SAM/SPASM domain-containing protein [Streptomyces sp. NPDC046939]|uniref:radical SAM/SPASM domain-containing protein n=1 Tax=Streptomyces sp. NPDC046939 TaxID=3155376 RepID=UPI0033DDF1E6
MHSDPHTAHGALWLDLTRKCQLKCQHCYNSSGPQGEHGSMSLEQWLAAVEEAARTGIPQVQLIGGEPTMHPDAPELVRFARALGMDVEVYSNLVHLTQAWWTLLVREGATLATSYYSGDAAKHDAITGRKTHTRTRDNIRRAVRLGIPIRVGIVEINGGQGVEDAQRDLRSLGVTRIRVDRVRPYGRAAQGQEPSINGLCGNCGDGRASIGPDGEVSPCVFSTHMVVGNVQSQSLTAILTGQAMTEANAAIRGSELRGGCDPGCDPNAECNPGFPPSDCDPRN